MKSKFKKLSAIFKDRQFLIEEDLPEIGWYLYVYEKGECIRDHLQADLDTVLGQANEDYGVPFNQWVEQND